MIVCSAATTAALLGASDAAKLAATILPAPSPKPPAANRLKPATVAGGPLLPQAHAAVHRVMQKVDLQIAAFDAQQPDIARSAHKQHGQQPLGRLNFAACMASAPAKHTGEPVLFKGNEFLRSDTTAARA